MRKTAGMLKSLVIVLVALLIQPGATSGLQVEGQDAENAIIADQASDGQQLLEQGAEEINNLKKELAEVREELRISKNELETVTEMYRLAEDALKQEKEFVGQLQGLDIKLNDKEHELVAARAEQESLVGENKRLQAEVQTLKAKTATEGVESVKAAQQRAETAEKKLKDQDKMLKSLQEEVHVLKHKLEAAERHLASRTAENDALARSHEERNSRLAEVENALKITEAAMLAAQAEVATKGKALLQAHQQWLPPWAAVRLAEIETKACLCWAQHVQPTLASLGSQAKKLMEQAKERAEPHVAKCREMLGQLAVSVGEAMKPAMLYTRKQHTRLMPSVREKWEKMAEALGPQVEAVRVQLNEAAVSTANFMRPRIEAVKVSMEPYLKVAHEKMKPTMDVVIEKVGPHAEPVVAKAREWAGAARLKLGQVHSQISRKVTALLLSHELTSSYVDKSIIWYMTTGLMLLPLLAVWIILSPYMRSSKKESEAPAARPRRRKYYPKHQRK